MKRRISIRIEDEVTDEQALAFIHRVVEMGRISGKSYCYITTFRPDIVVAAEVTKTGNDTFWVGRDKRK